MATNVTGQRDPWDLWGGCDHIDGRYHINLGSYYEGTGTIDLTIEQALELANLLVDEAKKGLQEESRRAHVGKVRKVNGWTGWNVGTGKTAYFTASEIEAEDVSGVPIGGMEIAPPLDWGQVDWQAAEIDWVDWEKVYEDEPEGL